MCPTSAKPPAPSRITSPNLFLLLILSFMDSVCLPCRPLLRFLFQFATKYISIHGFFFPLCGMLDYSSVFVIISLRKKVMQGLLPALLCHRDMWGIYFRDITFSHAYMTALFFPDLFIIFYSCPFLPFLSLYILLFLLPSYCQPCHLPSHSPSSQSVDIGFYPNM